MSYPFALLFIFTSLFSLALSISVIRTYKRRQLLRQIETMPFPKRWRTYLGNTVHYSHLTPEQKTRIERSILTFIHTKTFIGAGLQITEEMKAVIAFYACLIVLNKADYCYPSLQSVLVYADDFVVNEIHEHDGVVSEGRSVLDGQSSHDTVVLSWNDAHQEAYHPTEHNVIIHEFAHLLDFEDGFSDGIPPLPKTAASRWKQTLRHEFRSLEQAVSHGRHSQKHHLLGDYAATNEAEFFAVASERFFMQPERFGHGFPELYRLFKEFFETDPLDWADEGSQRNVSAKPHPPGLGTISV